MTKKKVKTWSLSSLHSYETCPSKWYEERFGGHQRQSSPALERGVAVHAKAEHYLLGNIQGVPKELQKFSKEFVNLKKHKAIAEEEWTLDRHWQPVPDGWEHKDTWLRAKGDARVGNWICDFKTGKQYEDKHKDQARLYANILMCYEPSFDVVDVEFWYVDSGNTAAYTFYRTSLDEDITHWEARVARMFKDKHFMPKENRFCNWCGFQSSCEMFR